ncbi:MAG: hypothetical protein LBQ14_09555 [Treponema sp.]|nr:hypothetical protein [Treponema sp.]
MKKVWALPALVLLLVSCARTTKVFTREELREFAWDIMNPAGIYFWDEFGQYRDQYKLSDEESEILGEWTFLHEGVFYFFPNGLFLHRQSRPEYKDDPTKRIEGALGIWSIRDQAVYARIFGFDVCTGRTENFFDETGIHEYVMVEPYEVKIINTGEIMPTGYARTFFKPVEPPKSIREQLVIRRLSIAERIAKIKEDREILKKGVGALRFLYRVHVITDTGKPEKAYNLFTLVPKMAEDNVSGLDIVTDPAMVEEYFVRSLSHPYEDRYKYIDNPGAAPIEF